MQRNIKRVKRAWSKLRKLARDIARAIKKKREKRDIKRGYIEHI